MCCSQKSNLLKLSDVDWAWDPLNVLIQSFFEDAECSYNNWHHHHHHHHYIIIIIIIIIVIITCTFHI